MKPENRTAEGIVKTPVALVQSDSVAGEIERNLDNMERLAEKAARGGAKWIQFPELTVCDYVDKAGEIAEAVPEGKSTTRMIGVAKRLGVMIGFGLAEKNHGRIYDSAVFVGPKGYLYRYRKTWLWHEPADLDYRDEWARFDPGTGPESFEIGGVRATCLICADSNSRRRIHRVAELEPQVVFFPINRHNASSFEDYAGIARTIEAPVLVTNRVGRSVTKETLGGSVIYSAQGEIVARANMEGREEILHYNLELPTA
ncbi:MAG TPA: carbon-nitrogen hydrolase family protein [Terriglobia bacterium]|nr:carbon-nitrogen hydrolase family protein [Terriglobia bacterium]